MAKKLSLVIPCYNESETLSLIVDQILRLKSIDLDIELVIVDDCSSDNSKSVAEKLASSHTEIKLLHHKVNLGKGAALRTGFMAATGDFIGVQDADMEYDPQDYLKMISAAEELHADIVFGSRYLPRSQKHVLRFWHTMMNKMLTLLSNALSDLELTDMETCYKMFTPEVIHEIAPLLCENRFGFEPEVTARLAKRMRTRGWRLAECPIAYKPRTFNEGKKIGWKDGVRAIWCIFKYNLFAS